MICWRLLSSHSRPSSIWWMCSVPRRRATTPGTPRPPAPWPLTPGSLSVSHQCASCVHAFIFNNSCWFPLYVTKEILSLKFIQPYRCYNLSVLCDVALNVSAFFFNILWFFKWNQHWWRKRCLSIFFVEVLLKFQRWLISILLTFVLKNVVNIFFSVEITTDFIVKVKKLKSTVSFQYHWDTITVFINSLNQFLYFPF